MTVKRRKSENAFTLIEVMIATVIIVIAVMGTSAFRYNTILFAKQTDVEMTAARTALLLCEGWRGDEGSQNYDPTTYSTTDLKIKWKGHGPDAPSGFNTLGRFEIEVDDNYYWATLSWNDISSGLRALNVVVKWEHRSNGNKAYGQADKSLELTTYVAN